MSDPKPDRRRTVCRALTTALEESELAGRVEPGTFFMWLSANFDALVRGERFDLRPLWTSLEGELGPHPVLPGLFLGLADRVGTQGLVPVLPPALDELDDGGRRDALSVAYGQPMLTPPSDGVTTKEIPVSDLELESPPVLGTDDLQPVPADPLPELTSQDLRPISEGPAGKVESRARAPVLLTKDRQRDIVNAVVKAIRGSPLGHLVDGGQFAYQLDAHFLDVSDGQRFDMGPVMDSLRAVEGFTERGVYAALLGVHRRLDELDVDVHAPPVQLTEADAAEVAAEERARARAQREERVRAGPTSGPVNEAGSPVAPAETPKPQENTKDARLRRYGLQPLPKGRLRAARAVFFALVLMGVGVAAWMNRPDRSLEASSFPMPLRSAEVQSGMFVGHLDDAKWYQQPGRARKGILDSMSRTLADRRLASGAVIIDGQKRIVAREKKGKLDGSRWLLESPDGTSPPPQGKTRDPRNGAPAP